MIWFGRNSSGTQSGERKRQCRDRSFHDSAGQATPDGHERTTRRPNSFNAARLHNPRSTAAAQLQHKTQKPAQKARCESIWLMRRFFAQPISVLGNGQEIRYNTKANPRTPQIARSAGMCFLSSILPVPR